jgi:hypothetical protein
MICISGARIIKSRIVAVINSNKTTSDFKTSRHVFSFNVIDLYCSLFCKSSLLNPFITISSIIQGAEGMLSPNFPIGYSKIDALHIQDSQLPRIHNQDARLSDVLKIFTLHSTQWASFGKN